MLWIGAQRFIEGADLTVELDYDLCLVQFWRIFCSNLKPHLKNSHALRQAVWAKPAR